MVCRDQQVEYEVGGCRRAPGLPLLGRSVLASRGCGGARGRPLSAPLLPEKQPEILADLRRRRSLCRCCCTKRRAPHRAWLPGTFSSPQAPATCFNCHDAKRHRCPSVHRWSTLGCRVSPSVIAPGVHLAFSSKVPHGRKGDKLALVPARERCSPSLSSVREQADFFFCLL